MKIELGNFRFRHQPEICTSTSTSTSTSAINLLETLYRDLYGTGPFRYHAKDPSATMQRTPRETNRENRETNTYNIAAFSLWPVLAVYLSIE